MAFNRETSQRQGKLTKQLNIQMIKKGGGSASDLLFKITTFQRAIYSLLTRDSCFSGAEIVLHCRWDAVAEITGTARANIALNIQEGERLYLAKKCCSGHAVDHFSPSGKQTQHLIPAWPHQVKYLRWSGEKENSMFLPKPIQLPPSEENFQVPFLIISQPLMSWQEKILLCHSSLSMSEGGLGTDSYIWIKQSKSLYRM